MCVVRGQQRGLTLAEVLVSIVIAAFVMVAVLGIYNQFQSSAAAVMARIEQPQLPTEILQLIAEDVDRLVDTEHEVRVSVENRSDKGYPIARLVLERGYSDRGPEEPPLEEIVWQGNVDIATDRIVLYRKHAGLMLEDKLLDPKREAVEASYPYIPLAGGLTAFQIRVPQGVNWLDKWQGAKPPTGIEVTIAQAEPQKNARGDWEVAEKDRFVRTIAIDRTRIIKFDVEGIEGDMAAADTEENPETLAQPGEAGMPESSRGSSTTGTPDTRGSTRGASQRSTGPRRTR